MLTENQVQAEIDRIDRLEAVRNNKIYGPTSLHSQGFLDPKCPYCPARAALKFVLEQPSITNALRPRPTANITPQEIQDQLGITRPFEEQIFEEFDPEEPGVAFNNLYDL